MTIIENKCEVYLLFSTVLGSRQLHCRAGLQSKVSIRVMRGKMGHFETFPRLARLGQAATGFSCDKYNIALGNYTYRSWAIFRNIWGEWIQLNRNIRN